MTLLQSLYVFQFFKYLSKYFAQYGAAILDYLRGTTTWRPGNGVNIWKLLWLSRPLIIWTDQGNNKISTFLDTLTSKRDKNPEIRILCHGLYRHGFYPFWPSRMFGRRGFYQPLLKVTILAQNWTKTTKSLWHCSFKKSYFPIKADLDSTDFQLMFTFAQNYCKDALIYQRSLWGITLL